MIIVSDTTPLISFIKIGHLDLLKSLFGEILIPQAVYDEMTSNPRYESEIREFNSVDFIKVIPVTDEKSVKLIQTLAGLDLGESEAIALAAELKSDFLLMDEARGRSVANQMGIKITGTIGILLEGFKKQLLTQEQIKECVATLKKARRFIDSSLFDYLQERIAKN